MEVAAGMVVDGTAAGMVGGMVTAGMAVVGMEGAGTEGAGTEAVGMEGVGGPDTGVSVILIGAGMEAVTGRVGAADTGAVVITGGGVAVITTAGAVVTGVSRGRFLSSRTLLAVTRL
jgi:hypothetical protein